MLTMVSVTCTVVVAQSRPHVGPVEVDSTAPGIEYVYPPSKPVRDVVDRVRVSDTAPVGEDVVPEPPPPPPLEEQMVEVEVAVAEAERHGAFDVELRPRRQEHCHYLPVSNPLTTHLS